MNYFKKEKLYKYLGGYENNRAWPIWQEPDSYSRSLFFSINEKETFFILEVVNRQFAKILYRDKVGYIYFGLGPKPFDSLFEEIVE